MIPCPHCGSDKGSAVRDSRRAEEKDAIRRRRVCDSCDGRFTTLEVLETDVIVGPTLAARLQEAKSAALVMASSLEQALDAVMRRRG